MPEALVTSAAVLDEPPGTLDADTAGQLFDLIGQSDLIERGRAMLVSIAPVKDALGERWAGRREQIWGLAERHLLKHLTPGDVCQRADEVHFLVASPELSSIGVQAVCYRGLMEVLHHFLGDVRASDLKVSQVAELSAERAVLRPFTLAELRKADAAAGPRTPILPEGTVSPLTSLASWPLKTADGKDLRVSFALDPVFDLKAWAMAGHRIDSRIFNLTTETELNAAQRRNLLPRDFERIDLAALERGLSRLEGCESFDRPKLIIQLSFASLSNGRARAALLNEARTMQHMLRQGAICELVDVEPGVPASRLTDVTSMVRSFFRSVWVQIAPRRASIEAACAAKASGLTVRATDLGENGQAVADGMRSFMALAKGRNLFLTVTSLPTNDLMIDAMVAGFTHATLRAERPG
jgi:hypothetical protein